VINPAPTEFSTNHSPRLPENDQTTEELCRDMPT
jgi:hypothetical protein